MKYRSPTGEDIRVTSTTGHVAIVGADWRELPRIYHQAAIREGCEVDQGVIPNDSKAAKVQGAGPQSQPPEAVIERALKTMLERDQAGDFTADDQPNLKVLGKLAGFTVTRDQVTPIYQKLVEETGEDGEGAGAAGGE